VTVQAEQGISHDEIFRRLDRVKAAAVERGVAAFVAIGRPFYERPANVAYLSNHFPPFPTGMFWGEMRGMGHSALVIPLGGDPVLIVDTTFRRDFVPIQDVRHARSKAAPRTSILPNLAEAIADALEEKDLGAARVGLIGDDVMPRGFGEYARPFIGHGIGYETMEPPLLYEGDSTPLQAGMVLCVEPGIEIPGAQGVRIEEEIIVTNDGAEIITRFEPRQWE